MMTHKALESAVQKALAQVAALDFVARPTRLIRIQAM
jgi:hypothetical protein